VVARLPCARIVTPDQTHAVDQRRHCQPLDKDREGNNAECGDGNFSSFRHSLRQGQCKDKGERPAQTTPYQYVLMAPIDRQSCPAEHCAQQVDCDGAAGQHKHDHCRRRSCEHTLRLVCLVEPDQDKDQ
jgi:hypothetical protein